MFLFDRIVIRRTRAPRSTTLPPALAHTMSSSSSSSSPTSSTATAHRRLNTIVAHVPLVATAAAPTSSTTTRAQPVAGEQQSSSSSSSTTVVPEAVLYSSRQIPLFNAAANSVLHPTSLKVDSVSRYEIPRLDQFTPNIQWYPNVFQRTKAGRRLHVTSSASPDTAAAAAAAALEFDGLTYNQWINDDEVVMLDIVRRPNLSTKAKGLVRAGPREKICWARGEAVAALVTCGGLCPGLNDVLAELFSTLYYNYGVDRIYGIRSGFRGFWDPEHKPWIALTPERMRGIYETGGTVLGSSRGGFDVDKILAACQEQGVNQVYIVGGDGTHRAANKIYLEARKRGMKMTVTGVPKTIDNDIGIIDRSFGFDTAVAAARKAIQSAVIEASCIPNGLGIVQLMGRHAGYIAAHATLASRQVDLCLIPEVPFPMHGPLGVLTLIEQIIDRQHHAVIVVAEGAGADLVAAINETDPSGNKKLPEIGKFLQREVDKHFKAKKKEISIKYHDPSYMIRSIPADAPDSVYCMTLAQNAVHGCMAGYTGFSSGLVNNRSVLLPIPVITSTSPSYLNPDGRTWERVVSLTHQPMWERLNKDKAGAASAAAKK